MTQLLRASVSLPHGYRVADITAFHRRDTREIAERVEGATLRKGIEWNGAPALLTIRFLARRAEAELDVDGPRRSARRSHRGGRSGAAEDAQGRFEAMLRRMLGLTQAVTRFERAHAGHGEIGPLVRRQQGLRVPVTATPFEALTWAITGQQISVSAAVTVRRRLIESVGIRHSSGLVCYPDAPRIAMLDEASLRAAGYTQAKARAMLALSRRVADGELPLDVWLEEPRIDQIRAGLIAVPGIGPWTVEYALLRGFGWLDGSLHGDVAVRRSLQAVLGSEAKIDAPVAERWLLEFSPWRALVAAHLWAADLARASGPAARIPPVPPRR